MIIASGIERKGKDQNGSDFTITPFDGMDKWNNINDERWIIFLQTATNDVCLYHSERAGACANTNHNN